MKKQNSLCIGYVGNGAGIKTRLAVLFMALLCAVVLTPQQVRAAIVIYYCDSEGEDDSQFCTNESRDQCPEDWTTASTQFSDQGTIIDTINPDIAGHAEWMADTAADMYTAAGNFTNAFEDHFTAAPNAYPANQGSDNLGYALMFNSFIQWVSSGQMDTGLQTDLATYGCGTGTYPGWRQPFQAVLNVQGMPKSLNIIVSQFDSGTNASEECDRNSEMYCVSNYIVNTYLKGANASDPLIEMGDFNESYNTEDGVEALASPECGLTIVPCNMTGSLSDYHTDPSSNPDDILDYILVSSNLVNKVRDCHIFYTNSLSEDAADHDAIYCTIGSLNPDVIVLSSGDVMVSTFSAPTVTTSHGSSILNMANTPDFNAGASNNWTGFSSLTAPPPNQVEDIIAATNSDGTVQLFTVGADHNVYSTWYTNGAWSGWTNLGCAPGGVHAIAIAHTSTGQLQLFGIGDDNNIYDCYQNTINIYGSWSSWGLLLSGANASSTAGIAAVNEADGYQDVFYVGYGSKNIYHLYKTSSGWTSSSTSLGHPGNGVFSFCLAQGNQATEAINIYCADTSGNVDRIYETAINSPSSWSSWSTLYSGKGASAVAAVDNDGTAGPDVFFNSSPNGTIFRGQYSGGAWQTEVNMSGVSDDNVSAITLPNGCIEVFYVGENGSINCSYQTTPGGSYSSFSSLGGHEL